MKHIAALALVAFAALNVYVMATSGLAGFGAFLEDLNGWSVLLITDLCIALTLVSSWMVRDAKAQNMAVVPYLLLTVFTGSIGPLAYLVRRPQH
jgi:hypothetical protein